MARLTQPRTRRTRPARARKWWNTHTPGLDRSSGDELGRAAVKVSILIWSNYQTFLLTALFGARHRTGRVLRVLRGWACLTRWRAFRGVESIGLVFTSQKENRRGESCPEPRGKGWIVKHGKGLRQLLKHCTHVALPVTGNRNDEDWSVAERYGRRVVWGTNFRATV